MGKDYYQTLGVSKTATADEIKKAYRKLALKWHPDRVAADKKDEAQAKFQEIGAAFDTLSDPEKKRIYDQVGEEGLNGAGSMPEGFAEQFKGAAPGGGGGFGGGGGGGAGPRFNFQSSGGGMPGGMPGGMGGMGGQSFKFTNADDIFKNFFGTSDPFAAGGGGSDDEAGFGGGGGGFPFMMGGGGRGGMPGGMGGMPGGMGGRGGGSPFMAQQGRAASMPTQSTTKAAPITHDLAVSLEDLYKGNVVKKMRITAKKQDPATGRITPVSSDKEINVKAGWKDGTKITFEREGDHSAGVVPADVSFVVKTKPHDRFKRVGDDLHYECRITLHEAICGFRTTVQSLDGRTLRIEAPNVTPDTVKILPGEGMPNSKNGTKGDMRVTFKITFPDLTETERTQIGNIIKNCPYKQARK